MPAWIEVSVTVDGEAAEAVAEALRRFAYQGICIESSGQPTWAGQPLPPAPLVVRAYIPDDSQAPHLLRQIEEALYYLGRLYPIPAPDFRKVHDEDWAEAWKKGYQPVRVGRRLLIKPTWLEADVRPDDIVIEIDPGMAFGTGTHPSTQLCLEALERMVRPWQRVLDLGTGSGILAIAAARLGAKRVLARDIDPIAVEVAAANVHANGVAERVDVQHGSLEGLIHAPRRFDLVVINILAEVIVELCAGGLGYVVWPGECVIASGIIEGQIGQVSDALMRAGLDVVGQEGLADWVALIARRRT
jgi:ribosomal protein L11 methyltransferase